MEEFWYLLFFLVFSRICFVQAKDSEPSYKDPMLFRFNFTLGAIVGAFAVVLISVRITFRLLGELDEIEEFLYSLIFGMGSAIFYLFGRDTVAAKEPTGLLKLTSKLMAISLGIASLYLFPVVLVNILF